jgi:predicted ArsR family transcriptional regulator
VGDISSAGRWQAVTALSDPSRRALYEHVRRAGRPVSREDAADATHISRTLAAFHLDKLVDAGLLAARFEAPAGPRGRGRTPKVYVPVGDGLVVTVPERRYELIAEILADGIAADPTDAAQAAGRQASRRGRELGQGLRGRSSLRHALDGLGFEPEETPGRMLLHNCPFHALAQRHTAMVCGLNHAFLEGLARGLGARVETRLAPRPGACCVEFIPTDDA